MQSDELGDIETGERERMALDKSFMEEASISSPVLNAKIAASPGMEVASLTYHRLNSLPKPLALHAADRRPDLSLQIPQRSIDISENKAKLPPTPSSSKSAKAPGKGLQSRSSSRSKVTTPQQVKKDQCMTSKFRSHHPSEAQPSLGSPCSLSKMFHTLYGRTISLPGTPAAGLRELTAEETQRSPPKPSKEKFLRSLSVPIIKVMSLMTTGNSLAVTLLVKPIGPSLPQAMPESKDGVLLTNAAHKEKMDNGEEIPEEEAVCRICFDNLFEGGPTLKMECCCKGELALAHEECALKWFRMKGNPMCDICGKEVKNLPVTITKLSQENVSARRQPRGRELHWIWYDLPVLVIISMLAYFCLLEQLLVSTMGTTALAIALPFACILGLLASITASIIASKNYILAYALMQYSLVVFFSHIFYSVIRLQAVLSILLAALAGFGIAISINALILKYLSWRNQQIMWFTGSTASFRETITVGGEGGHSETVLP